MTTVPRFTGLHFGPSITIDSETRPMTEAETLEWARGWYADPGNLLQLAAMWLGWERTLANNPEVETFIQVTVGEKEMTFDEFWQWLVAA